MKDFPYYLEIWLRGHAKDKIRELSSQDAEDFHPHITLIRPFKIKDLSEEKIIQNISTFSQNYNPIPYILKGKSNFENKFYHIPVKKETELLNFRNGLEKILEPNVIFVNKPEEETHLHATVNEEEDFQEYEPIEQYMVRLTGIKNKRIWFSYDFVTKEILSREQSLDKIKWYDTVHEFTKQTGLLPTKRGYIKIDSNHQLF